MAQDKVRRTDAHLIGRMILARWLGYSPDRYERLVEAVLASKNFHKLAHRIEVVHFPFILAQSPSPTSAIARLIEDGTGFVVAYRHPAWGKEFRVDGRAPSTGDAADPELDWLLRRLRLINTRNRLTHLILLSTAQAQTAFLNSGAWADLDPLSQAALGRRLACSPCPAQQFLPSDLETVDASMICRAVRGLTVHVHPTGTFPVRCLLPRRQEVLRYRLRALFEAEVLELRRGALDHPWSDEELRRQVQSRWGQNVARRTIAAARQALGIPAWRRRSGRPIYPPPGFDFSHVYSLTPDNVRARAPVGPGVYEIALSDGDLDYPTRASPVVYLGRSRNLRKRLRAHLYSREKFGPEPGDGRLVFRFATVRPPHLLEAEAQFVRAFCEVHGTLPSYNLVMPSCGEGSD